MNQFYLATVSGYNRDFTDLVQGYFVDILVWWALGQPRGSNSLHICWSTSLPFPLSSLFLCLSCCSAHQITIRACTHCKLVLGWDFPHMQSLSLWNSSYLKLTNPRRSGLPGSRSDGLFSVQRFQGTQNTPWKPALALGPLYTLHRRLFWEYLRPWVCRFQQAQWCSIVCVSQLK